MQAGPSRLKHHSRILTFYLHYQSNAYHIDIPDTNTMEDLQLQIWHNTSVPPCQQELHGWRKEPKGEKNTLKSLDLPTENELFMSPVSNIGDSVSQVMEPLNDIPPRNQLWSGWPPTVTNDSILANSGISTTEHKLIVERMPNKETQKEVFHFIDNDSCKKDQEDGEAFEEASESFEVGDDICIDHDQPAKIQQLIPENVEHEVVRETTTKRAYQVQLETMLQYMESHTLFARGQIMKLGPRGHEKFVNMWKELANDLNKMGPTIKDVKGWQNSWKNLRLSCKKKKAQYLTKWRRTGNVRISAQPLTDFETRVSAIFGKHGDGLSVLPELGLHKNFAIRSTSKTYWFKGKQVDQRNQMEPITQENDSEKEKKKRDRPSKEQLRALINYVEENPQLIPGIVSASNTHLWNDLTSELNKIIGGVVREMRAWVNCWKDMKSRVLQRRRLLMRSYDDDEATPLSEDNLYLLRILDRYEDQSIPSCSQARDRSPIVKPVNSHASSMKAPKTPTNKDVAQKQLVFSEPMIKSCRLQALEASTEPGAKGKGNSTMTSGSLSAARVIRKPEKKKTEFRGFGYLLGVPGTSNQPNSPIVEVDLTGEKNKRSNISAGSQAAINTVKEQNTLINDCAQLLIECFKDQNVLLRDGLARIADSISRFYVAEGKCEDKVKEEEKESALDITDEDTMPFCPDFNGYEETLAKEEQDILEEILEKEDEEGEKDDDSSEMTLRFDDF